MTKKPEKPEPPDESATLTVSAEKFLTIRSQSSKIRYEIIEDDSELAVLEKSGLGTDVLELLLVLDLLDE